MELNDIITKIENDELSTMSAQDLADAFVALHGKPEYKSHCEKVFAAMQAKQEEAQAAALQQTTEEQPQAQISDAVFDRNAKELIEYSKKSELDEESKTALGALQVVNAGNKSVDVREEIVETAKLNAANELVTSDKPLSAEEYKNAVHDEIAKILAGIISSKSNNNGQSLSDAEQNAQDLQKLYNGEQVAVNAEVVGGSLSAQLGSVEVKAKELGERFKNSDFYGNVKTRLHKIDKSLSKKLGDAYDKPRALVRTMVQKGTWKEAALGIGLGAVALSNPGTVVGVGATAGLAALSTYMSGKRWNQLIGIYKQEKAAVKKENPEAKYGFGSFVKNHKKDVAVTALYTVAAGASVWGAYHAVANAVTNGAATVSPAVMSAAMVKTGATVTAVELPHVADMVTANNKKEFWSAAKKAGLGAVILGAAYYLGSENAHAAEHAPHMDHTPTDGIEDPASLGVVQQTDTIPGHDVTVDGPDAPVDGSDTPVDGADTPDTTPVESHDPLFTVGDREQAFYERYLKNVPHSNIMVANVNDGFVNLPEGMTPEQAVHLAAMDKLYYGNNGGLQALMDCDSVKFDVKEYFAGLHDKFVTEAGDPRGLMGYPTDPNYVADPNIHARITGVDCDKVNINRVVHHGGGHATTPVDTTPPADETKVDLKPIESTPVTPPVDEPKIPEKVELKVSETPVDNANNANLGHYKPNEYNPDLKDDLGDASNAGVELKTEEVEAPKAPNGNTYHGPQDGNFNAWLVKQIQDGNLK